MYRYIPGIVLRSFACTGAVVGGRVAFAEVVRFDAGVVTAENLLWVGARLDAAFLAWAQAQACPWRQPADDK